MNLSIFSVFEYFLSFYVSTLVLLRLARIPDLHFSRLVRYMGTLRKRDPEILQRPVDHAEHSRNDRPRGHLLSSIFQILHVLVLVVGDPGVTRLRNHL